MVFFNVLFLKEVNGWNDGTLLGHDEKDFFGSLAAGGFDSPDANRPSRRGGSPLGTSSPQGSRRSPSLTRGCNTTTAKTPAAECSASRPHTAPKGSYTVSSGGRGYPLLRCNACGEAPPLKSNIGIMEEMDRLLIDSSGDNFAFP